MTISGETLRKLRAINGVKQETLAKKLGISQPAYCKLEKTDCINNGKLLQVIDALGYTEEEFEKIVDHLSSPKSSENS